MEMLTFSKIYTCALCKINDFLSFTLQLFWFYRYRETYITIFAKPFFFSFFFSKKKPTIKPSQFRYYNISIYIGMYSNMYI